MVSTKFLLIAASILVSSATANPIWGMFDKKQELTGTGKGKLVVIHCVYNVESKFLGIKFPKTNIETHFDWTSPSGTASYSGSPIYVAADKRQYGSMSTEVNRRKLTVDQASNKKTEVFYNGKYIKTGEPKPWLKELPEVKPYCQKHTKQDIKHLANLRVGFLTEAHVYENLPDILA